MTRTPIRTRSGFTILEVMIAAVIIMLVLVGLLSTLAKSQQLKQNTAEYQTALEAARQEFELIQSATYSTIFATYNNANFTASGLTPLPAAQDADGFVGKVTINNTNVNLLLITITVQWQGVMSKKTGTTVSPQTYTLTSQIADRNR